MLTTFQQLCSQAEVNLKKPIWEYVFEPTFGKPKLPNRNIPLNHQAAPYSQLHARRPCIESLRKTYALAAKYPINYSENMDEATKKANFLAFCSLAQVIQYTHDDFNEWEREIALEEQVLYQRRTLDDQLFFKWVENHDQREIEFKLARNKTVLHNLDVEKMKKTQELMIRVYADHTKQVEAEEKRKDFKCTVEARIESADHTKQSAKAEEHKGSSKTIKPRTESTEAMKRQQATNATRVSGESESLKARSKEEIQQEFREKMRVAATKCFLSKLASPSESTSTLDPVAPSISVSATQLLSASALPSLSTSSASTQTSLFTSPISPKTSEGPASSSEILSASPSTAETSGDSASSGPASSHSRSTPSITPPSTPQVSPPKASSATATPSKSPAEPRSSTPAMSAQPPFFDSPAKPGSRLPPLPVESAAPPQPLSTTRYTGPRHRPTPSEWVYPLSLCDYVVASMPYAPVKSTEAMMPPTEAVLMLPHTSVLHTLASAMLVHPSLLLQQQALPFQEGRPRNADAEEIEYLIHGLRAWWRAIFPKPQTREEAFARIRERGCFEEPLRDAFERAGKAEVKFMARRVWGLVRERGPGVRVSWEAGERVREWLGWERGELGFWD